MAAFSFSFTILLIWAELTLEREKNEDSFGIPHCFLIVASSQASLSASSTQVGDSDRQFSFAVLEVDVRATVVWT